MSTYLITADWSTEVTYLPNENKAVYVSGILPTGYELLGHVGYSTGSPEVRIVNIFKSDSNRIRFDIRNMNANAISLTIIVRVLLRKVG